MFKSTYEHILQTRLNNLTRETWPRRKTQATFYSFRHQLGSNLKASGIDRSEVAYLMGHQSTSSVDAYGDKRKGTGAIKIAPGVDQEQINSVVREKHSNPLSQQAIIKPDLNNHAEFGF